MAKEKFWFKAKNYGWGWYPSSWEGWATIVFYCLVVTLLLPLTGAPSHGSILFTSYLPIVLVLTLILLIICYRTGEKPEWRWGGKRIFK